MRAVELQMPRMADVADLLGEDTAPDAQVVAAWVPGFIQEMVCTVGPERMDFEQAERHAGDTDFVRALLLHTRSMLDTLRERGEIHALCPRCGLWEAQVLVQGYALLLAKPLPSTFDGPLWRSPWLGSVDLSAEPRPPLPRAARFRVIMPSALLGTAGPMAQAELGEIHAQPEEWLAAQPGEAGYDLEEARSGAGWRALLRLGRALRPAPPSAALDDMPLLDFLFLDLVHYLVDRAEVPASVGGIVECPRCSMRFLPLRRALGH